MASGLVTADHSGLVLHRVPDTLAYGQTDVALGFVDLVEGTSQQEHNCGRHGNKFVIITNEKYP